MPKLPEEKILAASVPEDIVEAFWQTVPPGYKRKHVMEAAARLWIEVPEQMRLSILSGQKGAGDFYALVEEVVNSILGRSPQQGAPAGAQDLEHTKPVASQGRIDDTAVSYIKQLALTEAGYKTQIELLSTKDKQLLAELRKALGVEAAHQAKRKKA